MYRRHGSMRTMRTMSIFSGTPRKTYAHKLRSSSPGRFALGTTGFNDPDTAYSFEMVVEPEGGVSTAVHVQMSEDELRALKAEIEMVLGE